jgi:hypothetical protein
MKRLLYSVVFLFILLLLCQKTYADPLIQRINPCILFGTCPTSTPTPSPIPSPTPTPTVTPTNTPTVTPIADTPAQISPTETTTPNITNLPSIASASPATQSVTPSPTPTKTTSTKEIVMIGVIGLLFLMIFIQAWPGFRRWLHEKTK